MMAIVWKKWFTKFMSLEKAWVECEPIIDRSEKGGGIIGRVVEVHWEEGSSNLSKRTDMLKDGKWILGTVLVYWIKDADFKVAIGQHVKDFTYVAERFGY